MTTVALVHATRNSLTPSWEAMERLFPAARRINFMDEGLLLAAEAAGGMTPEVTLRLLRLLELVEASAPDAALLTCTIATAVVHELQPLLRTPLVAADTAMLREAIQSGPRVGLVYTARPTLETAGRELARLADQETRSIKMVPSFADGAFEALLLGRTDEHDALVEAAARRLTQEADVIVLAQMSMARAAVRLADLTHPVHTSPEAAVRAVRSLLGK